MITVPDLTVLLRSVGSHDSAAAPASEDLGKCIIGYLAQSEFSTKLDHKGLLQILKCLRSWSRTAFLNKLLECGMEHALARTYDTLLTEDYSKIETLTSVQELLSLILDISTVLKGREVFGEHVIPRVLALAPLKCNSVKLQRVATKTLCALIAESVRNQQAFLRCTPDCHKLFRLVLPRCGDFHVQATVSEILYKLLKSRSDLLHHIDCVTARAAMSTLLQVKKPNLPAEIRNFVSKVNESLGYSRRVYSFLADKIITNGHHIPSSETWVDFGAYNITFCGDDAAGLVDIPYSKVSKIDQASEACLEIVMDTSTEEFGCRKSIHEHSGMSVLRLYLKSEDLRTILQVIIPNVAQQILQQPVREGRSIYCKSPPALIRKASTGISIPLPRTVTDISPVAEAGRLKPATVGSRILAVLLASRGCVKNNKGNEPATEQAQKGCNDPTREDPLGEGFTGDGQQHTRTLPSDADRPRIAPAPSSGSAISSGEAPVLPANTLALVRQKHGALNRVSGTVRSPSQRELAGSTGLDGVEDPVQDASPAQLERKCLQTAPLHGTGSTVDKNHCEGETVHMVGVHLDHHCHGSGNDEAFCGKVQPDTTAQDARMEHAESVGRCVVQGIGENDRGPAKISVRKRARSGVRRGEITGEGASLSVHHTEQRRSRRKVVIPNPLHRFEVQQPQTRPKPMDPGRGVTNKLFDQSLSTGKEGKTVSANHVSARLHDSVEGDEVAVTTCMNNESATFVGNLPGDNSAAPLPENSRIINRPKPRKGGALQQNVEARNARTFRTGESDRLVEENGSRKVRNTDDLAGVCKGRHKEETKHLTGCLEGELRPVEPVGAQGHEPLAERTVSRKRQTLEQSCTQGSDGASTSEGMDAGESDAVSEKQCSDMGALGQREKHPIVDMDTWLSIKSHAEGVIPANNMRTRRFRRRGLRPQDGSSFIDNQLRGQPNSDDQGIPENNASEANTPVCEPSKSSPLSPATDHFPFRPRVRRRWIASTVVPQDSPTSSHRPKDPTDSLNDEATADSDREDELDSAEGGLRIVARMLQRLKRKNELRKRRQFAKILAELTSKVQLDIQALDSSFKKDNEEMRNFFTQNFEEMQDALGVGNRKMEGSFQQFKVELNEHLQLCKQITTRLESTRTELQSRADKQRVAHERLLGQAQELGSAHILETERKLQAVQKAAARVDSLHELLSQALVDL